MPLASHLALVPWRLNVDAAELTRVSAALQKQVQRDFAPIWNMEATVDAFVSWEDVPSDYWRISLVDPSALSTAGEHDVTGSGADVLGQPYALVAYQDGWPASASHECLEMLADPAGHRLVAGPSPQDPTTRVEFLVEVCDPCQTVRYSVNGVMLCDFCTPQYFDPVAAPGVRYSFSGRISQPREVLRGGYLAWYDPASGHWWRRDWLGEGWADYDMGTQRPVNGSLRSTIDTVRRAEAGARASRDHMPSALKGSSVQAGVRRAAQAKAAWLDPQIRTRVHGQTPRPKPTDARRRRRSR